METRDIQSEGTEIVIGEVKKNSRDIIRVSIKDYKGSRNIDQRVYYQAKDGSWKPTPKGISISPTHCLRIIALIKEALDQIDQQPA